MGYTMGSSGKRYRVVPPEGVTGLLAQWQRRLPTFETPEKAIDYADQVFASMLNDDRPVVVMLGEKKVGAWTVNGWVAS